MVEWAVAKCIRGLERPQNSINFVPFMIEPRLTVLGERTIYAAYQDPRPGHVQGRPKLPKA